MNQPAPTPRRTFGMIGAGAGAVVQKEMRTQGRRWGTYIARSAVTVLLLGVFVLMYLAVHEDASRATGARKIQSLQQFAPALSIGVLWIQFVMVVLVAPVLTGPAICDERRTGTLAALLTTPLNAVHIVLGKLFGALVQLFVLALLPTPLLLVVRVFGGLDAETVLAGFVLTMSMGLLAASLGMFFSTRMRRGAAAGAAGMVATIALHAVPAVVMAILTGTRAYAIPFNVVFSSSSPAVMVLLSANLLGDLPPVPFNLRLCWVASAGYSLTVSLFVVAWTIISLRRAMTNFEESAASAKPRLKKKKAKVARAAGEPVPHEDISEVRAGRTVGDWPVLWRELRQTFFGSWRTVLLVLGAIIGLVGWAYYELSKFPGGGDELVVHGFTIGVGTFFTLVLGAVLPAGLIGIEREARTFDTLLTTRLTPWQIVAGKALGSLRRQIFFPCVVLSELAIGVAVLTNVRPTLLLHYVMVLAPVAFFLACTGVLAGTLLRRSVHAVIANVALCVVMWLMLPIGHELVTNLFGRYSSTALGDLLKFINPVFMTVVAAEGGMYSILYYQPAHYAPFNKPMSVTEFTLLLAAFGALYTVAGFGALKLAAIRLRSQFAGA